MNYELYLERRETIRQTLEDAVKAKKDVSGLMDAYASYDLIRCNWNERVREITSQKTQEKKVNAFLKDENSYMTAWMRLMKEYHKLTGCYLLEDCDRTAIVWAINVELIEYVGE